MWPFTRKVLHLLLDQKLILKQIKIVKHTIIYKKKANLRAQILTFISNTNLLCLYQIYPS